LYVGIHKEPSFGAVNSDFCIGSVFHNAGDNFIIMEKRLGQTATRSPNKLYTRLPGATDVIGVAVDGPSNLISIYVNGKFFYSFSILT
jgi:hypothetical protein